MEHFKDTKILNNTLYYLTYIKMYKGTERQICFYQKCVYWYCKFDASFTDRSWQYNIEHNKYAIENIKQ